MFFIRRRCGWMNGSFSRQQINANVLSLPMGITRPIEIFVWDIGFLFLVRGISPSSFECSVATVHCHTRAGLGNGSTFAKSSRASILSKDAVLIRARLIWWPWIDLLCSIGIGKMLHSLGMSFDGRHHSGLDDSINIARIALELIKVCSPWYRYLFHRYLDSV